MSSVFPFIPRSVAQRKIQSTLNLNITAPKRYVFSPGEEASNPSATQKQRSQSTDEPNTTSSKDEELSTLMELTLSEYTCWCNPELQHKMRSGYEGYLPLKQLIADSPVLSMLQPRPSEVEIMRCIRASSGSLLETRILITESSRNEWFDRGPGSSTSYQSPQGGFEVRRKDWETLLSDFLGHQINKDFWDKRTIYIERLPAPYRSTHAVAHYIKSLLMNKIKGSSISTTIPVQSVTFPPHHLASLENPHRCRGFAFVVLESLDLVDLLCRDYPWEGPSSESGLEEKAVKFGMRVLPKIFWEKLKTEYLAYQTMLLSEVAENIDVPEVVTNRSSFSDPSRNDDVSDVDHAGSRSQSQSQSLATWYPQNCLIFVRNIDPETNKTTLKALFSASLVSSKNAVDYVDFNKGINSCHLRLASPSDATQLISHFNSCPTAQENALDQVGAAPTKRRPAIEMELVQGKREELYWEKVPEKIRDAALARMHGTGPKSTLESRTGQKRKCRRNV